MAKFIHPIAGGIAFLIVALFLLTTITVELLGTRSQIIHVKTSLPYGLLFLIPAMVAVGAIGHHLTKRRRSEVLNRKARRLRVIAANGLLVLVPSALFLAWKAQGGALDTEFYAVQMVELLGGALNVLLIGISFRDGKLNSASSTRGTLATTLQVADPVIAIFCALDPEDASSVAKSKTALARLVAAEKEIFSRYPTLRAFAVNR